MYYIYLLECRDKSFYCGYTSNLEERITTHNQAKGSKYTRTRLPVKLVYSEEFEERKEAMQREREIKKLSRKQKEELLKKR